jgi:hypothetical protein
VSCEALSGVPERLWSEARASTLRLLALDYDGTLAPFAIDPAAARRSGGRSPDLLLRSGPRVDTAVPRPLARRDRRADRPGNVAPGVARNQWQWPCVESQTCPAGQMPEPGKLVPRP